MNFSLPRFLFGLAILAFLAIYDLHVKGRASTRWKEYAFLLSCVAAAIVYGIVNDQITSRISWEYFYYGKELAPIIGPQTPPDPWALSLQAIRIGVEATWSAGLILGVAMLIANNPSAHPRLPYHRLFAQLPRIIAMTVITAAIFGFAGYKFWLNSMGSDLSDLASNNLWRPHRFLMVYGIHLGGYVGGGISLIVTFITIRLERRRLAATDSNNPQ